MGSKKLNLQGHVIVQSTWALCLNVSEPLSNSWHDFYTCFAIVSPFGQDDHLELPTGNLWFGLLSSNLGSENIYRNNVTPWPGGRFAHRGKNPWSLIEGGGTIVELWHVTRWILHCKTAVVTQSMVYLCCPGKLWTWRCWTFAIFATRRTARMAGLPCNGNVEQRSPANSTTGWGTTDHTPSEMDCTAMLCISEPKTHHASELRK